MRLPLLLELAEKNLQELVVHGDKNTAKNVVNIGKDLWLLPDDDLPEDLLQALDLDVVSFHELPGEVDNSVFLGSIDDRYLYVYEAGSFHRDPKSSVVIKKIVTQLGLRGARYQPVEDEVEIDRSEILGKIPNIAYHGTSTTYIDRILKLGLKPGEKETNYPQVVKVNPDFLELMENTVYFSTRFDEAKSHAEHTVSRKSVKGDPIVIQLKIPDKNKLVTDYDVGRESPDLKRGFGSTKEVGVYGYKGRVPASHLERFWIALGAEEGGKSVFDLTKDDYQELDMDELKTYIWTRDEFGYGMPYYDPEDYED